MRGDEDSISSATMSSSDKDFSRPTNIFSVFKSNGGYSKNNGEMGDEPNRVYDIAFVMQVVQPSEKKLDRIRKETK